MSERPYFNVLELDVNDVIVIQKKSSNREQKLKFLVFTPLAQCAFFFNLVH